MQKNFILTFLLLIVFYPLTYAQQWTKTFNGTANGGDAVNDMVTDGAGNVYITGNAVNSGSGNDFTTIKYNTDGQVVWTSTYNGPGNGDDVPNALFVDGDGFVYVTGYSDSLTGPAINNDVTTVKYSADGNLLWVRRYDGTIQRNDAGNDIRVDAEGSVYVGGYKTVSHSSLQRKDFLTVKYSASGQLQWTNTFNGAANQDDEVVGIGLDESGNVYVSGTTFSGNDPIGEQDYFTIKYNTAGTQLWTARYNGPSGEPDRVTDMVVDGSGNSYVTGYSQGTGLDWATVKYNSNGIQQWVKRHDGKAHNSDIAYALVLDAAGNIIVTGSDEQKDFDSEYRTIKYNSAGALLWSRGYDPTFLDLDEAQAVAADADGNVYVTGYIHGVSPSKDIVTIKYSSAGVKQWLKKFDGTGHGDDVGNAVGVDAKGNVYVSGLTTATSNNQNFITLKYGPNGLKESAVETAAPFVLQNSPNPFSDQTTISYSLPLQGEVRILITDAVGTTVREINSNNEAAGVHSFTLDTRDLPAGNYFCKLVSGDVSQTRIMTVVK
jgi:uncharacterized delta-60 repeat protein